MYKEISKLIEKNTDINKSLLKADVLSVVNDEMESLISFDQELLHLETYADMMKKSVWLNHKIDTMDTHELSLLRTAWRVSENIGEVLNTDFLMNYINEMMDFKECQTSENLKGSIYKVDDKFYEITKYFLDYPTEYLIIDLQKDFTENNPIEDITQSM